MAQRVLIVKWKQGGIYRKEEFARPSGVNTWLWVPDIYSHDYKTHDLFTPGGAYLTVSVALRLKLLSELCEAYSISVMGGLSAKELERILKNRLSRLPKADQETAFESMCMTGSEDRLDVEMLPPEAGRDVVKANVWRTDRPLGVKTGGTRVSFETFVLEGKEWKWLPKSNCFWYPTKVETQQKAP